MSARDELELLLTGTHPVTRGEALDAYRAEVLAEAADRVADLLEATPEYGLWVAKRLREMAAEAGESRA